MSEIIEERAPEPTSGEVTMTRRQMLGGVLGFAGAGVVAGAVGSEVLPKVFPALGVPKHTQKVDEQFDGLEEPDELISEPVEKRIEPEEGKQLISYASDWLNSNAAYFGFTGRVQSHAMEFVATSGKGDRLSVEFTLNATRMPIGEISPEDIDEITVRRFDTEVSEATATTSLVPSTTEYFPPTTTPGYDNGSKTSLTISRLLKHPLPLGYGLNDEDSYTGDYYANFGEDGERVATLVEALDLTGLEPLE